MRIAFLLTQSLDSPSGLGRYWPISKELVRIGHQVTILALHPNFEALGRRSFTEAGVEVHYVGQMHVRKVGSQKLYFRPAQLIGVATAATLRLARAALRTPADIYHLGKAHPMNGLAAMMASTLRRRPLYLDCDDYEAGSNRFSKRWQQRGVAFFEDNLPKAAAGITVNTHFTQNRLQALGYPPEDIVYVPNGVDRERFRHLDEASSTALKRELGLEGRQVILYVGSLSLASHAVDLLLEAFAILYPAAPGAALLLVGGGEDLERLQRQAESLGIRPAVHFAGRIPPDQVPLYYHFADVSVDPVHDDPAARGRSPLKIVESLVAGPPAVTADVGDRAEMLAGGGGLLVEPGDPEALAEALRAILEDASLRDQLSAAAWDGREAHFWDQLVHDFIRVYDTG